MGLNGETRPLQLMQRYRPQPAPRRASESMLPVIFGVSVMLLVATTWVGTHRTISSLGDAQLDHLTLPGHGWAGLHHGGGGNGSAAIGGGGSHSEAAGGAAGAAAGAAADPGPGDTTAAATGGSALARIFSALKRGGSGGGGGAAGPENAQGGAAAPQAAEAAEAAAAGTEGDIVLHAERVTRLFGKPKADAVAAAAKGAAAAAGTAGKGTVSGQAQQGDPSAAAYKELYGANPGGVLLGPLPGGADAACPPGAPSPRGAAAAVVVLAGPGSAGRLGRVVPRLLQQWGALDDETRGLFHLYLAVDGSDAAARKVATHYASETMGGVRAIIHDDSSGASTSGSDPSSSAGRKSSGSSSGRALLAAAAAAEAAAAPLDPARPRHLLFLMRLLLECSRYPALLALADGAALKPDALQMFAGAQWLLARDPSLWCISGAASSSSGGGGGSGGAAAADRGLLLRTDAVEGPAHGWLVPRHVGRELLQRWRTAAGGNATAAAAAAAASSAPGAPAPDTAAGWLAWLRSRAVRRGRQCLVPDVPRVAADSGGGGGDAASEADAEAGGATVGDLLQEFGGTAAGDGEADGEEEGDSSDVDISSRDRGSGDGGNKSSSGGKRSARRCVDWLESDLAWLAEPSYGRIVLKRLRAAAPVSLSELPNLASGAPPRRLRYATANDFTAAAQALRITLPPPAPPSQRYCHPVPGASEEHCLLAFVPPVAFCGVVPAYTTKGARVFLVPAAYDAALGKSKGAERGGTHAVGSMQQQAVAASQSAGAGSGAAAAGSSSSGSSSKGISAGSSGAAADGSLGDGAFEAEPEPPVVQEMDTDAYLDAVYGDDGGGYDEDSDKSHRPNSKSTGAGGSRSSGSSGKQQHDASTKSGAAAAAAG